MATGLETIAFEVSKQTIVGLVKPAVAAAYSGLKSVSQQLAEAFTDRFSEYTAQQAIRHSCLSTIVFGHQKSLEDLYIPLTVTPARPAEGTVDKQGILIDRFRTALLPVETRVLITDTAGMGKSTLSKFLFLQCLKSLYAIPVFLELRHLSERNTVSSVVLGQLNSVPVSEDQPRFSKRQMERLFSKGGMIFFLDGYDEIPFKDREAVTRDIKEFIEKYPKNLFVITSRPESGLLAFPAFKQYNIRPLTKEESFQLIRKYDQNGGRSEQLIAKLKGRDFVAVQQFLRNPLLTSLLYRSFEYKQNVPLKKHIFYRQVFDALFDWHDASKDGYNTREKKSGLDIDAFHRVLRVIGFVSVMKGQVEGDTDTVLGWIRKARDICSTVPFAESHFLDDLVRAVPVFVKDGDYYRWSHKSLAEYFAAQYICTEGKPQQEQVLGAFIKSGRVSGFSNVLDQVYDIDPVAFRTHLILPFAKAFTAHWQKTYRAIDPSIDAAAVKFRREITFDRIGMILPLKTLENGEARLIIEESLRKTLGAPDPEEVDFSNFDMYMVDPGSSQVAAFVLGPYATIADILYSKNDPLIRRDMSVSQPRTPYRFRISAGTAVINDDPTADHNSAANFSKVNAALWRFGPIVNSEKALAFEASFKDGDRLAALAEELLRPITDFQRTSR